MKTRLSQLEAGLALFALCTSLCLASPAVAQSAPAQSAQDNGSIQAGRINTAGVASFRQFLDSHPEIAEQLRRDPSLVDNREFLEHHPDLNKYLDEHPGIAQDIRQQPNAFMQEEDRLGRRPDINPAGVASFRQFLDSHPEIAEQLRRDPSLVDNREFLEHHPDLNKYLDEHPGIAQEIRQQPDAFMRDEQGLGRRPDINPAGVASFRQFLDSHPEIAQQLRRDPSLVDNREFLKNHPDLNKYLDEHPGIAREIRQQPDAFMVDEERFDRGRDDRDRGSGFDTDTQHRYFGQFLGAHADIAQQLARNPSEVRDQEFLQSHPELQEFLNQNPDVRQELMANPDAFVKSSQQFTNTDGQTGTPMGKPKTNQ